MAPDLADRVLTVSGVSKTYAMTGWRVGFAGGPARLIAAMARVQGQATGGVSPVAQAAAVAALGRAAGFGGRNAARVRARCRRVAAALAAVPGVRCAVPAGAFYVFPQVAGCLGRRSAGGQPLEDDAEFAAALMEEALVGVVHGAAFGMAGHVRISTAAADAALDEACRRIGVFCSTLE